MSSLLAQGTWNSEVITCWEANRSDPSLWASPGKILAEAHQITAEVLFRPMEIGYRSFLFHPLSCFWFSVGFTILRAFVALSAGFLLGFSKPSRVHIYGRPSGGCTAGPRRTPPSSEAVALLSLITCPVTLALLPLGCDSLAVHRKAVELSSWFGGISL